MSEEQILLAIARTCQDNSLHFQIIVQKHTLHIYVNRQTENLDYQQLTSNVYSAISSLKWLQVSEIWLYSRVLGEVEPDWQTYVEVEDTKQALMETIEFLAEEIEVEIEITESLIEDLSCAPTMPAFLVEKIEHQLKNTEFLVKKLKKELTVEI